MQISISDGCYVLSANLGIFLRFETFCKKNREKSTKFRNLAKRFETVIFIGYN